MAKQDEAKLAKLIRKNMAKAAQPKGRSRPKYDSTLQAESTEDTTEHKAFFAEMKKREF